MAETVVERHRILEKLEKYYLKMTIPDSISRNVRVAVNSLITQKQKEQLHSKIRFRSTSDKSIEYELKDNCSELLLAQIRGDDSRYRSLLEQLVENGNLIDKATGLKYWKPWINAIERFDLSEAKSWLMAERAERLCYQKHLTDFIEAEKYGALALQLLQIVPDQRIRLDVHQRLITILFRSYGMYDLASQLAERELYSADSLKYYLRATGICYNYAEALFDAGKNNAALKQFRKTVQYAENYHEIPSIIWYRKNGMLGIARTNLKLGNYEKTLAICAALGKMHISPKERIILHINRGVVHRIRGNYDQAKRAYETALNIARENGDIANQIQVYRNMGILYQRLSEYDIAVLYFDKAMNLLQAHIPDHILRRSELLINQAEIKILQDKPHECEPIITELQILSEQSDIPNVRAELLHSLGKLSTKLSNHQQALDYFQQAILLYEENGWLNLALETENDLARCFVSLLEYSSAQEVLRDVFSRANKLHDSQCKIDAFGMMAEIAYAEGNLKKAIRISNRLTKEIESLSSQFSDMDNLTIFRQKIHHYLQNAVLFEIKNGRLDSAFVKLDYIKARTARYRLMQNRGIAAHSNSPSYFMDLRDLEQQLNDNELIINYFITADTLYAFLLNDNEIELLQKPVKIEDMRSQANAFLNSINETIDIFQHQNPAQFIANYDTVTSRSRRLYHLLLDWRELQIRLRDSEITYIIPDDILYGIPFSCLINEDETDMQYLIEQTAIVSIPGAFFLQKQHKFDSEKSNRRVLVCADPISANAAELIHLIKKKYPRTEEFFINKGVVKKEDILAKLNEEHNITILIGHSVANTIIPDSSSFELSIFNKIDPKPHKVALSLADFKKVDWSATEMVFLIGCETANGKLYEGTGYCGFQQALLARGAQNVLASLWKIDANETINQIVRFLTIWRGQSNPSLALQEVKIQTIRQLQQDAYYKKPHPYLWGSFTLWQTVN